jgi:hypothetical protein
MKNFLLIFFCFLLLNCNQQEDKNIKQFQGEFNRITDVSPSTLCELFLEKCTDTRENNPFSQYTPEMINSQCASMYRSASEDHAKLIGKILIHKKMVSSSGISMNEMEAIIRRIRKNQSDELDKIVLKSFDSLVYFKQRQLELE